MKITRIGLLTKIPALILLAGILFSCVNDLDAIQKVSYNPNAPDDIQKDLKVFYTDSGYARVHIFAKLAETYTKPKHITKFKNGVKVDFYSAEGKIISKLTANSGEVNYETGLVVVSDSVILKNVEKKQYLFTEELFWNQKDSTIYTDKNVVVKTEGKGITGRGRGLKTTQSFDKYKITKPVGKVQMSED